MEEFLCYHFMWQFDCSDQSRALTCLWAVICKMLIRSMPVAFITLVLGLINLWKYIEFLTQYLQYIYSYVASGVCNVCVAKLMITFEAKQDNTCYLIYFSYLKNPSLRKHPVFLAEWLSCYSFTNLHTYPVIHDVLWHLLVSH